MLKKKDFNSIPLLSGRRGYDDINKDLINGSQPFLVFIRCYHILDQKVTK